jgi:hypothetical protein
MKTLKRMMIASALSLMVMAFVPVAKADPMNLGTRVTIDQPIQVGDLVLAPGTYEFRLADYWLPRVVMIFSDNGDHYVGIVMGVHAYRKQITDTSTFSLVNIGKGSPEALQYWYYPDRHNGIQFIYPHVRTSSMQAANNHTAKARVSG